MLAALLTAYIAVFIADVDVGNKTEFVLNFIPMLRQIVVITSRYFRFLVYRAFDKLLFKLRSIN